MAKKVSISTLLDDADKVSFPIDCVLNGQTYHCEKILRWLPKKRVVIEAFCGEQHVVIKLFHKKAMKRQPHRCEHEGYEVAVERQLPVPQRLSFIETQQYSALVYAYLEDASPVSESDFSPIALLRFIAKMHQAGVCQADFHMDNILVVHGDYYLIDMGGIRYNTTPVELDVMKSLKNLAMFIAQFKPDNQQLFLEALPAYAEARKWSHGLIEHLDDDLKQAWQKRQNIVLEKCFRQCTATEFKQNGSVQYAFKRGIIAADVDVLVEHIDAVMQQGTMLKDGNSATVVKVDYAGLMLVIKRYNIKSFLHFLKRAFRRSRAANSWQYAHLLELVGIPTTSPIGYIEKRWGFLRRQAYFISLYSDGKDMASMYASREPSSSELTQIKRIFTLLQRYHISHGDLKATNWMISSQGIVSLIDLDAMQYVNKESQFERLHEKDKARFIKNWQSTPHLASMNETVMTSSS